jgi:UDP-N-acetylmuramate--alanine ligase
MSFIDSEILLKAKKIHLIGISGIGMSGIAEYLLGKGYIISGSDLNSTFITERLESLGAKIFIKHNIENIPADVDFVIYTSAVKNDNEEYKEAQSRGITLVRRAEMLGLIVNDKILISVSGTHGKTSTTAGVAKVLIDNGFDPTVFVGGNIDFLEGGSSRIGNGKYAVVEADEYDRSFLALKSDYVIITNIELDHTDIYKDIEDVKNSFENFCNNSKPGCVFTSFGDDKNVREVLSSHTNNVRNFYGFGKDNQNVISNIKFDGVRFNFEINNEIKVGLNVFGKHNALNAAAAYITCREIGISGQNIIKSLESFKGVDRRLQLKYNNKIKVYDDYAHHPTEIKSSVNALRELKSGRIIAVFQPHLFTRTKDFYKEFAEALSGYDLIILTKIYPAREKEITGVSSDLILKEIKKNYNNEIYYCDDNDSIMNKLTDIIQGGDSIVFQGAGDITNLCDSFINKIKNEPN